MADRVRGAGASVAFDAASLAHAVNGTVVRAGRTPIRGGAVDSRRVEPGTAFFALPGERTDGHRFVADALQRGAAAVVVSQDVDLAELGEVTVVRVDDTGIALQQAATEWRNRFDPLVVGVTGSLAKTSTKEQIAEVLSERWTVLRNEANENNEIGLPLTMLRMGPEHGVAVLEMGMYTPGDIALLAALARPSIGVVTAVRGTHLSRAGSIDDIERGKRELVEALPAGGTAILNADDPRVARMAGSVSDGVALITYGFDEGADVRAEHVTPLGLEGMLFELRAQGDAIDVRMPALGRHSVHNGLAAAAVGLAAGMGLDEIARGLARPWSAPHRSTIVDLGPIKVLDDSYNASPDSMIAALDLLASLPGRHVAILGEMLELGDASSEAHQRVASYANDSADVVVGVGPYEFGRKKADLLGEIDLIVQPGDVVLIKGSRGAQMEEFLPVLEAAASRMKVTVSSSVAAQLVQAILLAFALVVILMPPFILLLRRVGFGKRIRVEGPGSHMVKEGTPSMGGVLMIAVVAGSTILIHFIGGSDFLGPQTIAPLLTLLVVGALGAADDYLNSTTGEASASGRSCSGSSSSAAPSHSRSRAHTTSPP